MLATSSAHPRVIKIRLLYGLLNRGEAYLIPTWLMPEQRLAHLQINQSCVLEIHVTLMMLVLCVLEIRSDLMTP